MTISLSDNNPRISYTVNAGATQTSFTVPFEFFDIADLNVYVDGTQKSATTHYTVSSGGSGSTGTIALTVTGASGGSTVVITRDIDLARTTDFPTSGSFNIAALNTELDKITAQFADRKDDVDRSLRLQDSDTAASMELPLKDARKGTVLGFNATTGVPEAGPTIADVSTLSAVTADIATLADIEDGTTATDAISDLAAIKANVTTVAGVASNVTTVAGQTTNMANITNNLSAIQNAATNATTATTKASEAATSATNAASSATSAASSASTATTKASEASTSATNSASSASTASGHKDTATTKASEAASSATAAAASASTASTQASNAATSASTSSTQATNSASSATASANSATAAASSATAAASSATAAAASQTAAAASASSAASSFDSFDDRYLGPKSSDPSQDNDGNSLVSGALYFNSTANEMRVYDGANWIAATSAGSVSLILYEYTATAGQTTFSGSDDNSATLSYTADNLQVVMNGVILDPSDFTATNGTSVVLASGAALNDIVNIYAFKSFTTADMVSKTNGGTFSGAVGFSGGITGDVAFDTNTLKVDSSNNRVGIGTASPSDALHIKTTADADIGLQIQNDDTQAFCKVQSGGTALYGGNGGVNFVSGSGFATRLHISSDGNIGINTTAPTSASGGKVLAVETTSDEHTNLVFNTANTGKNGIIEGRRTGRSGSERFAQINIQNDSDNGEIRFYTAPSGSDVNERARITSGGQICVNTTSASGTQLLQLKNANVQWQTGPNSTNGSFDVLTGGNGVYLSSGSTGWSGISDETVKDVIEPISDAVTKVDSLRAVIGKYKNDDSETRRSFLIAQDVEKVLPEAVDEGSDGKLGLRYTDIIPLLVAAMKEQKSTIEALQTRIAALETAE